MKRLRTLNLNEMLIVATKYSHAASVQSLFFTHFFHGNMVSSESRQSIYLQSQCYALIQNFPKIYTMFFRAVRTPTGCSNFVSELGEINLLFSANISIWKNTFMSKFCFVPVNPQKLYVIRVCS